jgi:elongation factor G
MRPVTSDLNALRAEIYQIYPRGKHRVVEALVLLRQMFDYSDEVRSLAQGRASWTMEAHSYAPLPRRSSAKSPARTISAKSGRSEFGRSAEEFQ